MTLSQLSLDLSEVSADRTYFDWIVTHKGDFSCRNLADRHYSRQIV